MNTNNHVPVTFAVCPSDVPDRMLFVFCSCVFFGVSLIIFSNTAESLAYGIAFKSCFGVFLFLIVTCFF